MHPNLHSTPRKIPSPLRSPPRPAAELRPRLTEPSPARRKSRKRPAKAMSGKSRLPSSATKLPCCESERQRGGRPRVSQAPAPLLQPLSRFAVQRTGRRPPTSSRRRAGGQAETAHRAQRAWRGAAPKQVRRAGGNSAQSVQSAERSAARRPTCCSPSDTEMSTPARARMSTSSGSLGSTCRGCAARARALGALLEGKEESSKERRETGNEREEGNALRGRAAPPLLAASPCSRLSSRGGRRPRSGVPAA